MASVLERYENWIRSKGLSERTVSHYIYYYNRYNPRPFGQRNINEFISEPGNNNSVARGFVKSFQEFLITNYRDLNMTPEQKVKIIEISLPKLTGRKPFRIKVSISYDDIAKLSKQLKTELSKLQLLMSFHTGVRLEELFNIRLIDFDWAGWRKDEADMGEVKILGKGNKERIVPVPSFLMERIREYAKSVGFKSMDQYVFRTPNSKGSIKTLSRSWQRKLRDAGIMAGLTQKDSTGAIMPETAIHPHKLRRSYATYLHNNKVPLLTISKLLGHKDISTTQVYLFSDPTTYKRELEGVMNIPHEDL